MAQNGGVLHRRHVAHRSASQRNSVFAFRFGLALKPRAKSSARAFTALLQSFTDKRRTFTAGAITTNCMAFLPAMRVRSPRAHSLLGGIQKVNPAKSQGRALASRLWWGVA